MNCVHPNCKQTDININQLCDFHQIELDNNGLAGHWNCTWCSEFKKDKYACDQCGKLDKKCFRLEDDAVCEDCYEGAISRAEYAYESAREEGLV